MDGVRNGNMKIVDINMKAEAPKMKPTPTIIDDPVLLECDISAHNVLTCFSMKRILVGNQMIIGTAMCAV